MNHWSSVSLALIISCFLSAAQQSYANETLSDTLFFTAESHLFTSTTTDVSFSLGQSYPPKERFSYEVTLHLTKSAAAAATSNAPCGKHCLTKRYTLISNATANLPLSVPSLLGEMEQKFNRDEAKEEEEEMAIMKPSSTRYIHLFVKVFQMEAAGEVRGKLLASNVRTIAITDNLIYYFDVVMSQAARPEYWSVDSQFIRFEAINFAVEPKGWLQSRLEDSRLGIANGDESNHSNASTSTAELTYSWAITGPVKLTLRKPEVITSSKPSFSATLQRSGRYMVAVDVVLTEEVTERLEGGDGSSKSTTTTKRGYFTKMIEVKKRKHFF